MAYPSESLDASPSRKGQDFTLNKYFPVRDHKFTDCFKSSFDILNPSNDTEKISVRSKSNNQLEYRNHSDMIKISPVKRYKPKDELSLSMLPEVLAYNTYGSNPRLNYSTSPQRTRTKDTSFNDVGENPDKPLVRGCKHYESLNFTYSDKQRDPARLGNRFYRGSNDSSPNCNVARALKIIYEQYPETTHHGAVSNSQIMKYAESHPEALYNNVLSDLGAGGGSTVIHQRFQGERNGKRKISSPQKEMKHLLAWPYPVEESQQQLHNQSGEQTTTSQINARSGSRLHLRTKSKEQCFSELTKSLSRQASNFGEQTKMNSSVQSRQINRRSSLEGSTKTNTPIQIGGFADEESSINMTRGSIGKVSTAAQSPTKISTRPVGNKKNVSNADSGTDLSGTPQVASGNETRVEKGFEQAISGEISSPVKFKNPKLNKGFQSQMNSNYSLNKKMSQTNVKLMAGITNSFTSANNSIRPTKTGPNGRPQTAFSSASKAAILKSLIPSKIK